MHVTPYAHQEELRSWLLLEVLPTAFHVAFVLHSLPLPHLTVPDALQCVADGHVITRPYGIQERLRIRILLKPRVEEQVTQPFAAAFLVWIFALACA